MFRLKRLPRARTPRVGETRWTAYAWLWHAIARDSSGEGRFRRCKKNGKLPGWQNQTLYVRAAPLAQRSSTLGCGAMCATTTHACFSVVPARSGARARVAARCVVRVQNRPRLAISRLFVLCVCHLFGIPSTKYDGTTLCRSHTLPTQQRGAKFVGLAGQFCCNFCATKKTNHHIFHTRIKRRTKPAGGIPDASGKILGFNNPVNYKKNPRITLKSGAGPGINFFYPIFTLEV